MFQLSRKMNCRQRHPILDIRNAVSELHMSTPTLMASKCDKPSPLVLPNQLESIDTHHFCLHHVRKYDRENYLAALCIKDRMLKRVVFALRAFNVELSLVRDMTTNSDRAKIRFHFWSKLIDEIIERNNRASIDLNKEVAYYKHTPLAKELLDLFYLVDVDEQIASYLKDLVGARVSSKVLGYKPFESISELELYCTKSNASIYHLALRVERQVRNIWSDHFDVTTTVDQCAHDMGIAQGLSNVIRGVPYNATKNCCYIPKDLLDDHQLTNRDFITKNLDGGKIRPLIKTMAEICQARMDLAIGRMGHLPKHYKNLFLPRVAIQSSLNTLKKCDYNICDSRVSKRNELLPLSLKLSSVYFRAPIL